MTPKCIFLTAYFLEHLNNSSDGARKPLGDTEITAGERKLGHPSLPHFG